MEVWTRPRRAPGAPAGKPPSAAMSLLFSLAAAIKTNETNASSTVGQDASAAAAAGVGGGGSGGVVPCAGLDVALAGAPVGISRGVVAGGVVPGDAVKLGLRLSAGQAGDRDVVSEVRKGWLPGPQRCVCVRAWRYVGCEGGVGAGRRFAFDAW